MIDNIRYIGFLPDFTNMLLTDNILYIERKSESTYGDKIHLFVDNPNYIRVGLSSFMYNGIKFETYYNVTNPNYRIQGLICKKVFYFGKERTFEYLSFLETDGTLRRSYLDKEIWRIDNTEKNLKLIQDD